MINNDYGVRFERESVSEFKGQKKNTGKHKSIRYAPKVAVVNSEAATTLYPEIGSVLLKAAYKQR